MAYDTFYKELDYPDVGGAVSFYAVQDGDDPNLWHGRYELALRSSGKFGDGTPDFVLGERDFEVPPDWSPEAYLGDVCDEDAPAIPVDVQDMWTIDFDLCSMSEDLDTKGKTLRELLDEYEGGMLAGRYEEYAAFAKANGWSFRGLDGGAS